MNLFVCEFVCMCQHDAKKLEHWINASFLVSVWNIAPWVFSFLFNMCKHTDLFSSSCCSEDNNKRRSQRSKDFKDEEKALHAPILDRNINCKPTLKWVMVIVILGTLVTVFYHPSVYDTDHLAKSITGYVFWQLCAIISVYFLSLGFSGMTVCSFPPRKLHYFTNSSNA